MKEEKESWSILLVTVLIVAILSRLFYRTTSWLLSPLIILVKFLTTRYEKEIVNWIESVKQFFRRKRVYD